MDQSECQFNPSIQKHVNTKHYFLKEKLQIVLNDLGSVKGILQNLLDKSEFGN